MSGATFRVNDVAKPVCHHAASDAATVLAAKAAPPSPAGLRWNAASALKEYMAKAHKEGDETEEEVAGYMVRRLQDAPEWLVVQPPPDESSGSEPYFYNPAGHKCQWNHPTTGVPMKPIGLVAPDSLSPLQHPLLHGVNDEHGFIAAITTAFAEHRPLALRPEHIWTLVLQAVAIHVNQHAEELRSRFVAHDGKLALVVRRDDFVLGAAGHDWPGVVAEFSEQIERNTVADATKRMATEFSTTTTDEKIAGQMTVMHAMEKYFDYRMMTMCGFPSITLEGSAADWRSLRRRTEELVRASCTEELSSWWLPALLPVLDRFAAQYEDVGDVDVQFWQSMAKIGGVGGSGGCTWLNGWYNVFFPQLKSGARNNFCVAYSPEAGYANEDPSKQNFYAGHFGGTPEPDGVRGPDIDAIPTGVLRAPVSWNYFGQQLSLEFHAGFVGAEQRPDGTIAPAIGWYIRHQ